MATRKRVVRRSRAAPPVRMPWYYIYSEKYLPFYRYLSDVIDRAVFAPKPIRIPQRFFDRHLYRVKSDAWIHHWTGVSVKVEKILAAIRENPGRHIVFSDANLVVRDGVHAYLTTFMKAGWDLVLVDENARRNIGFLLIHCNERSRYFWRNVLAVCHVTPNFHDQQVVNALLASPRTKLRHTTFDRDLVTNDATYAGAEFLIYKGLAADSKDPARDLAKKFETAARFVDLTKYRRRPQA